MKTRRQYRHGGALYNEASVPSEPGKTGLAAARTIFQPGRNCVAVTRADEVSLLVDSAAYYRDFMRSALLARESLLILGWDFHTRTPLLCADDVLSEDPRAPRQLGEFLDYLCRRRPQLRIRVLVWDFPTLFGTEREFPLFYSLRWTRHRHIELRYDGTHRFGGSHHQKVVVVDERIAYCGGIDLTGARWDTCGHLGADSRRLHLDKPYAPMHDLMLKVTGATADTLGALARQRWRHAGGSAREPTARSTRLTTIGQAAAADAPHARNLRVAISRTFAAQNETGVGVREVEQLYLDMIRAARHSILVENQYFTAQGVGDALAERLAEPDGPEVVIVLRLLSHGWLEEMTMERLRSALLRRLQDIGGPRRIQVYYPHVENLAAGMCVDVHSKLMIVDDQWLRVGSANLANRSMRLDSECDLTIEAQQDPQAQLFIRRARATLLGEHLDCEPAVVEQCIAKHGSLIGAIEALRGRPRTLLPLQVPDMAQAPELLAEVGDPEQPVSFETLRRLLARHSEDHATNPHAPPSRRRLWIAAAAVLVVTLACTLFWKYSPLAADIRPDKVIHWARQLGALPWAPLVVLLAYTPGCLVFFPRPLITLFAVVAFGPWLGFVYSLGGLLIAALALYGAGRLMDRDRVERFAGEEVHQMMQVLRRRGLIAMTALRLVPLAPFSVEGVMAGAIRIKLWHYTFGTALGMAPGTLAATVFSDQLKNAVGEDADQVNYWLLGLVVVLLAGGAWFVRRWFRREQKRLH
jgi:phospholipase D1/2